MDSIQGALAILVLGVAILWTADPAEGGGQNAPPAAKAVNQLHYAIYLSDLRGGQGDYARLDVLRSGKIFYHFAPEPFTNSGGKVVEKSWAIPEKNAAALIDAVAAEARKLKSDPKASGLHRLKLGDRLNDRDEKLDLEINVTALPAAIADRLLPLLQEAHPDLWKQKELPKRWKVVP